MHGYPNGGRGWRYEFELLDEPCEGPHTIYYDANGNPTKTNETANRGKNRKAKDEEMPKNGDSSQYPENHTIANHRIANQHIAKQCNFVENLIEMATCTERMDFNGSIISYKNVIDRINEVYNSSNGCERGFEGLLFCVNRRYREASIRFKLDNPKQYMKPIIWESFSFYKLDWQNFFNRTYYGDYKD